MHYYIGNGNLWQLLEIPDKNYISIELYWHFKGNILN